MLRDLPTLTDPRVLAGPDLADDAGVYRLRDDLALVQSTDFFTPVVDDPFTYGQIAVANSLSDLYAMGTQPLTALNIVVFPATSVPMEILGEILRGGSEKAQEAGVSIIGGHTVEGQEPLYGLAVTGTAHPDRLVLPSTAQAGDLLILTKPLGTGVIATALKAEAALATHVEAAVGWMTRLNNRASSAMLRAEVHAATDITGYGLLGHLSEMGRASGIRFELQGRAVPLLPGALDYARRGFIPMGGRTNEEFVLERVVFDPSLPGELLTLLTDPQTSGGLLLASPAEAAQRLKADLEKSGDLGVVIGHALEGDPGHILIR